MYHITEVFQGVDVNKPSASKVCDVCHYLFFLSYNSLYVKDAIFFYWFPWKLVMLLFQTWKVLIIPVLLMQLAKVRP